MNKAVKIVFRAYLHQKWIDLRQTKTTMISGSFYTYRGIHRLCVNISRGEGLNSAQSTVSMRSESQYSPVISSIDCTINVTDPRCYQQQGWEREVHLAMLWAGLLCWMTGAEHQSAACYCVQWARILHHSVTNLFLWPARRSRPHQKWLCRHDHQSDHHGNQFGLCRR